MDTNYTTIMDDIDTATEIMNSTSGHEIPGLAYDSASRIAALSIVFAIGLVGNLLVYVWLYQHRKEQNRIQVYITSLTTTDVLVLFVILSELIQELEGRVWRSSDAACKLFRLYESLALMASSNMVVGIAIDRYHSVIRALKKPLPELWVIGVAWMTAFVCSLPQLAVFRKDSKSHGASFCMTGFGKLPKWHIQLYVTYVSLVAFLIPFIIICYTYLRILLRLWLGGGSSMFKNKSKWQRTSRWRTLKMTMVIISAYVLCNVPFFSMQLIRVYVSMENFNMVIYGIFGIFASCNSATNPYVFLFFNVCKSKKGYEKAGSTQQTSLEASNVSAGPRIYRETRLSNGNEKVQQIP
ncbi:arg8-vasotocin receptor-like [Lytechinus pictus]|uniref:arg8-vasotocin receptor-like n=1 Tax=Lytechinus pictus TaxID=7653 RepID=UPI00240CF961|nr:arg8-vasotocin receptor-like [Lytechinus pictus]